MKRMNRMLSMLLAVLMILTSVMTVSVTAAESEQITTWWSDNAAGAFAGGKGTEAEPYQIATAAQLAYFANYLEGGALNGKTEKTYFEITENIDMSAHQWKPVGYTSPVTVVEGETTTNTYAVNTLNQAVLNGNGKLVSGVKLTASQAIKDYTYDYGCAMFTKIVDSTIQNLTLEVKILDPVLTADKTTTFTAGGSQNLAVASSGVAALAAGTFGTTTVDNVNVTLDMDVNATGGEYIYAGLVAYALENTVLTNSTTSGTIDITAPAATPVYVSGVLGRYFARRIENCTNNVDMTVVGTNKNSYYGGVVALTQTGPNGGNLVNNGDMDITLGDGGNSFVGGIFATAAVLRNDSTKNNIFTASHNNGNITVRGGDANFYVGGIIGQVTHQDTRLIGYTNSGNITVYKTAQSGDLYVGGIAGKFGTKNATVPYMQNCLNNGNLTANLNKGANLFMGGLAGICYGNFIGCTNNGNLSANNTAAHFMGGIAGAIDIGSTAQRVEDCLNRGSITVTNHTSGNAARGGMTGRVGNNQNVQGSTITFDTCVNLGYVQDGELCGGLIGYNQAPTATTYDPDKNDVDGDNNTTEKLVIVTKYRYTVALNTCFSLGSGATYSLVGSHRADNLIIQGCFSNTEKFLSCNNQNIAYDSTLGEGYDVVSVNGVDVHGNGIHGVANTASSVCAFFDIVTLEKARARLDAEGTDESGIRFDSYIEKEAYDTLKKLDGATVELGTMIAPTENFKIASVESAYDKMEALDAITISGTRYVAVPVTEGEFHNSKNYDDSNAAAHYYFSGALKELKNYELAFTAIAYVKITIGTFSFTVYADYDTANTDRSRSISQIATMAYEDRVAASSTVSGVPYTFEASAENACFLGAYSPYSNAQLTKLKAFSSYVNDGKIDDGVTVNGVSLEKYKIVYADSPINKYYGSNTGKTLYEDLCNVKMPVYSDATTPTGEYVEFGDALLGATYDYDYQTAVRLQAAIKAEFAIELDVVCDADAEESNYEILVGLTNRAKSMSTKISTLTVDEYIVRIDETKLVVCGGSYGATWHAIDAFDKLFASIDDVNYNFKSAGNLDGSYDLQKIACIGDSITRGSQSLPDGGTYGGPGGANATFGSAATGIYFEQFLSYPANLQRLMWQDAVVYNFGRGSSTAGLYETKNDSNYYAGSYQFYNCLTASNDSRIAFDLVFMMHGTNDSGRLGGVSGSSGAAKWTAEDKKYYLDAVKDLMDQILEGSPNATFVMNNIPHRFDTSTDNTGEHNTMAMKAIQKETAEALCQEGYFVYHFDMNQYIRDNLVVGECSCSGYDSPSSEFDSEAEVATHGYYYNTETTYTRCEGTHPNFRGYNKMADGIKTVVDYLLNGAEAPKYMIEVGTPDRVEDDTHEDSEWSERY